jgi:hypothetical protein
VIIASAAILEMGASTPGAQYRPDLVSQWGLRVLEGTSDTGDRDTQMKAYHYAEVYNLLLLWRTNERIGAR